MSKTKFHQARGYLEYAKVFEENRDLKSPHKGIQKKLTQTDGEYKVNFYPATKEEKEKMLSRGLSDPMYGGYPRFKEGNSEFGIGEYVVFKRCHIDPSGYEDLGGPPSVIHFDEESPHFREDWSFEKDGALGNGTEVELKYTTYGEGEGQSVRLYKIGVLDHVEYDNSGSL